MDDFIIAADNPSKYMHVIEIQFKVGEITDSLNYYPGGELVRAKNIIHVL